MDEIFEKVTSEKDKKTKKTRKTNNLIFVPEPLDTHKGLIIINILMSSSVDDLFMHRSSYYKDRKILPLGLRHTCN
jgi:hypothetical protein